MNGWNPKSCLWIRFRIDIPIFNLGDFDPVVPHVNLNRDSLFATGHKMSFCRFPGGLLSFTPGKLIT